jgi:phosphoglycerol transferase
MKKKAAEYTILTILVVIGICIVYRVWAFDVVNTPLSYVQDGLGTLAGEKMIIEEGGLGTVCSRLGAPYGQNSNDFATSTILPILLMKLGAFFTENWIWGLNLSYFMGYFITAWVTYYILGKFKISWIYAVVLSVLYTFLPYHMLRGTEHFALAFYGLVPVAVYYVVEFMGRECDEWHKKRKYMVFCIWMLLVGLNGIYYSFFSCFLFCVAILYNLVQKNGKINIFRCLLGILSIVAGVLIASIPNFIYIFQNGRNEETVYRFSSEIAVYALRIAQLILPITEHRIPILAKIKDKYNASFTVNENDSASLGIIFTLGFIVLCIILIMDYKKDKKNQILKKLAVLNICMVLYASVGGGVEIQAIIFKLIRCSNRISVFIAFVCCIAFGYALDEISEHRGILQKKRKMFVVAFIILVVGFFDQTRGSYVNGEQVLAQMQNEKEFIQNIEALEKENTMIFQLPNVVYPEQGMKERMGDYSHLIGYLYSDTLKWSYGAIKGREGSKLLEEISSKDTVEMIRSMKEAGFGGIYIDRWGYKEGEIKCLEKELEREIGFPSIEDRTGRYVYYSFGI